MFDIFFPSFQIFPYLGRKRLRESYPKIAFQNFFFSKHSISRTPSKSPLCKISGMDMAQLICGGCRTLLMYSRGATSVRCSCCHTVNLAPGIYFDDSFCDMEILCYDFIMLTSHIWFFRL